MKHGDKLFALTESPVLQEVDPDSLTRLSKGSHSPLSSFFCTMFEVHNEAIDFQETFFSVRKRVSVCERESN